MAKQPEQEPSAPENRALEEESKWTWPGEKLPERTALGRFALGSSGNPGGVPREAVELRRLAMHHSAKALLRAAQMLDHPDPYVAAMGMRELLARGLGRYSAPTELPTDEETSDAGDTSPKALLDRAQKLIGRNLGMAEKQLDAGMPLSEEQRASVANEIQSLAAILKADKESGHAPGADMSDEKLIAAVLANIPAEKLEEALEKRKFLDHPLTKALDPLYPGNKKP